MAVLLEHGRRKGRGRDGWTRSRGNRPRTDPSLRSYRTVLLLLGSDSKALLRPRVQCSIRPARRSYCAWLQWRLIFHQGPPPGLLDVLSWPADM
jgi:hypothetical protein